MWFWAKILNKVRVKYHTLQGKGYMHQISQLIQQWNAGNEEALTPLIALSYQRLRASTRKALDIGSTGASIQESTLVHEFYLSFQHQKGTKVENSEHFFAVSALKIWQILHARYQKNTGKKVKEGQKQYLSTAETQETELSNLELIVNNGYLNQIETIEPISARIAELKLFWQFNNSEIAEILNIRENSVLRKWQITKALIAKKLTIRG